MSSSHQRRHTALLNDIPAEILDALTQSDLAVLNYLDELALEGAGDACAASIPKMADACGISERQVQISAKRLIDAELIKRVGYDFSNPDRSKRGTVYRVLYKVGGAERTAAVKERKRTIKFLLIWSEEQ
jgi:DNA-binding Lrp family transcriptional regulator